MLDMRDRAAGVSARPPHNDVRDVADARVPALDTFLRNARFHAEHVTAQAFALNKFANDSPSSCTLPVAAVQTHNWL